MSVVVAGSAMTIYILKATCDGLNGQSTKYATTAYTKRETALVDAAALGDKIRAAGFFDEVKVELVPMNLIEV
jgi:hypothetical protein